MALSPRLATPAASDTRVVPPVRPGVAIDLALLLAVGLLALALRLPEYRTIPAFTDELAEISYGLEIARGHNQPLTSGGAYKGAFWTWLLAGAFKIGGEHFLLPRALVMAFGVLTVLATYALGRAWGGRLGGLLAGGLMATAAGHIAVNSHVAWGSCTTPLFAALGTWALWSAARPPRADGEDAVSGGTSSAGGSGQHLVLAGLAWGLALQTHPLVLALLPGAVLFLLWQGRPLLRSSWLYLAAALFLLANLNLLVYNLAADFRSISASLEHSEHYTGGEATTLVSYARRLGLLLQGLLQLLAGAVEARPRPGDYLLDPGLWAFGLLALAGLAWQWRRGNPLPTLLALGPVLIFPLLNDKFAPILNGRYLAPLLPILFAAIGALLADPIGRLRGQAGRETAGRRPARLALIALGLVAAFVLVRPLVSLQAFYAQERAAGRTNEPVFAALDTLRAARAQQEPVLVVRARRETHLGAGNGLASQAFRLALDLGGIPHRVVDWSDPELTSPALRCRDHLAVVASRDVDPQREVVSRLRLRGLDGGTVRGGEQPGAYGVYRLARLPDAPPC